MRLGLYLIRVAILYGWTVAGKLGSQYVWPSPPDQLPVLQPDIEFNDGDLITLGTEFYVDADGPSNDEKKPPAPRYVVYADDWHKADTFPNKERLGGFNHSSLLEFGRPGKAVDNALSWQQMSSGIRTKLRKLSEVHYCFHGELLQTVINGLVLPAGKRLVVSDFGWGPMPTTEGKDPVHTARELASFVHKVPAKSGSFCSHQELRKQLGTKKIVSHAPIAPWFHPKKWPGGGYLRVHRAVDKFINSYNIQLYNQGKGVCENCETLMVDANGGGLKTSVMEVVAAGVPGSKIVVGHKGFEGSAMVWQWSHAGKKWVSEVKGA
ncbi:hypothetical protein BKA62DRAFT_676303 [Auriculariales sp. MPI-PUGE-AT-0066]|nr:hypothetical protein BKA62DRAFT_676303 [Auriculariales sp. MPI-PUGE-AT-0066]